MLRSPNILLYSHWSELCMNNELMTSQLNFGANPISRVTVRTFVLCISSFTCILADKASQIFGWQIASLADIGYQVNFANADPYGTAQINPSCLCNTTARTRRRRTVEGTLRRERPGSSTKRNPVRALGANNTVPLSPAVLRYAIAFGKAKLAEYAQEVGPDDYFSGVLLPGQGLDVVYVGDRHLSVIVQDRGSYYSVLVLSDAYA
jgi:hypothetical protein